MYVEKHFTKKKGGVGGENNLIVWTRGYILLMMFHDKISHSIDTISNFYKHLQTMYKISSFHPKIVRWTLS